MPSSAKCALLTSSGLGRPLIWAWTLIRETIYCTVFQMPLSQASSAFLRSPEPSAKSERTCLPHGFGEGSRNSRHSTLHAQVSAVIKDTMAPETHWRGANRAFQACASLVFLDPLICNSSGTLASELVQHWRPSDVSTTRTDAGIAALASSSAENSRIGCTSISASFKSSEILAKP